MPPNQAARPASCRKCARVLRQPWGPPGQSGCDLDVCRTAYPWSRASRTPARPARGRRPRGGLPQSRRPPRGHRGWDACSQGSRRRSPTDDEPDALRGRGLPRGRRLAGRAAARGAHRATSTAWSPPCASSPATAAASRWSTSPHEFFVVVRVVHGAGAAAAVGRHGRRGLGPRRAGRRAPRPRRARATTTSRRSGRPATWRSSTTWGSTRWSSGRSWPTSTRTPTRCSSALARRLGFADAYERVVDALADLARTRVSPR